MYSILLCAPLHPWFLSNGSSWGRTAHWLLQHMGSGQEQGGILMSPERKKKKRRNAQPCVCECVLMKVEKKTTEALSSVAVDLSFGRLRQLHVFFAHHESSQLLQDHTDAVGILPLGQWGHSSHINLSEPKTFTQCINQHKKREFCQFWGFSKWSIWGKKA